MSCPEIHVDDIGTQFVITILDQDDAVVDLSAYSTKQILFTKPSGTVLTKTASFYTDGTDGKLSYTSIFGDLSEAGLWRIQAICNSFHSNIGTFTVHRNLA